MQLTFAGAAGEVTGSRQLFAVGATRFAVDVGMFRGGRDATVKNRAPWGFAPAALDFVVLTHAHLDHCGLLPRLVRDGFRGRVYATTASRELIEVLLQDSAELLADEARRERRQRGRAAAPLYTLADVEALMARVAPLEYGERRELAPGVAVRLQDAGHILGSAIVELWLNDAGASLKVVVSGDLGQPGRPILKDPATIDAADVLLVESTYGDRNHKPLAPTLAELIHAVGHTLNDKHGMVLVPAFAVGRTQELLYWFERFTLEERLPALEVIVDSPLASAVTAITERHVELFDAQARGLLQQLRARPARMRLRHTHSVAESMALDRLTGGAVILAGSGMCDGGRIRHHLARHLSDSRNTVLITGYQAAGTLGRQLAERAKVVRIYGRAVLVRAEIRTLGGLSAHADQEALLGWLRGFAAAPRQTFLVHGEPHATAPLAERITRELGWTTSVPERDTVFDLSGVAHG